MTGGAGMPVQGLTAARTFLGGLCRYGTAAGRRKGHAGRHRKGPGRRGGMDHQRVACAEDVAASHIAGVASRSP